MQQLCSIRTYTGKWKLLNRHKCFIINNWLKRLCTDWKSVWKITALKWWWCHVTSHTSLLHSMCHVIPILVTLWKTVSQQNNNKPILTSKSINASAILPKFQQAIPDVHMHNNIFLCFNLLSSSSKWENKIFLEMAFWRASIVS